MKQATAKAIIAASEVIGLSLVYLENYSGRGMYGNDTHAVIGNHSEFLQACCYAAATIEQTEDVPVEEAFDLDGFLDEVGSFRTDSMGRSDTVWY